jgi:N-acetylmuramic acid 6-phosphate etherase
MVDVRPTNSKLRRRAARLVEQIARVDRETAERALGEASDLKTAIVALRLGLPVPAARERLDAAEGHLRQALGER